NFLYSVEGERKAVFYMIAGGFCFATMGALTFDLGKKVDWVFIAFCRMLFSFVLVFFLASKSGNTPILLSRKLLWLRSLTGTIAMLATFYSFTHLPVSDVSAITETRPVWVAILAVAILGEKLRKVLIPVTILSILGVLFIEKPHFDQRNFAVFVTLAASVLGAV
ncbi:MAG: EamA family transporter, partial [Candidatus Dadabacteria bacterium]|nr:EamA family transporter [Candidatus Dadabacteria bacterium]NIT14740.1 EamA family transporter [Candidatus Dadabacteria bacterium]